MGCSGFGARSVDELADVGMLPSTGDVIVLAIPVDNSACLIHKSAVLKGLLHMVWFARPPAYKSACRHRLSFIPKSNKSWSYSYRGVDNYTIHGDPLPSIKVAADESVHEVTLAISDDFKILSEKSSFRHDR